MDIADGFLFDEIVEEIEMLLQLKPPAHKEILGYKNLLLEKANSAIEEASSMSEYASNEIQKRNFLQGEISSTEWDIRKDYLEKIVEVMGRHQMIPLEKPMAAEVAPTAEFYPDEEEEEEEVEIETPRPRPKAKPKVSKAIKQKQKTRPPDDFEV
jgi:hypothetical protein